MKIVKTPPNEIEACQSFENFERLATHLMAVPKKELDEQIAKYEREKARAKKKSHK